MIFMYRLIFCTGSSFTLGIVGIVSVFVFVCVDALHPSQQFFSYIRTLSCLFGFPSSKKGITRLTQGMPPNPASLKL